MIHAFNDIVRAPELFAGGQWFNASSNSIQVQHPLASLRGKVVLIDFWTYTCINCVRTLPYLKNWYTKYKDKDFVIIGVHTPEFEFEKNPKNVQKAVSDFGITYPVMQDNNYATWNAYANHYWPAEYFIDKTGKIRGTHFGEGNYDETEKMIQTLLAEAGQRITGKPDNPTYTVETQTPELYLGYNRIANLESPEQIAPDRETHYSSPATLDPNMFAYTGIWTISGERAIPAKGASVLLNFDAKKVFLVMKPKSEGASARVKISLNGKPVAAKEAGDDVKNGTVTVDSDRLYTLINLEKQGAHVVQLDFPDDTIELYAFTFG